MQCVFQQQFQLNHCPCVHSLFYCPFCRQNILCAGSLFIQNQLNGPTEREMRTALTLYLAPSSPLHTLTCRGFALTFVSIKIFKNLCESVTRGENRKKIKLQSLKMKTKNCITMDRLTLHKTAFPFLFVYCTSSSSTMVVKVLIGSIGYRDKNPNWLCSVH